MGRDKRQKTADMDQKGDDKELVLRITDSRNNETNIYIIPFDKLPKVLRLILENSDRKVYLDMSSDNYEDLVENYPEKDEDDEEREDGDDDLPEKGDDDDIADIINNFFQDLDEKYLHGNLYKIPRYSHEISVIDA